jgi:hypothetical protein
LVNRLGAEGGSVSIDDRVAVDWIEFDDSGAPSKLLGRDQRRAGSAEPVVDDVVLLGAIPTATSMALTQETILSFGTSGVFRVTYTLIITARSLR